MTWLGVDLGGTNTKLALLNSNLSSITHTTSILTDRTGPIEAITRAALLARAWVEQHPDIAGIGITLPGHFDADTGRATVVPNIPGDWTGLPVRQIVAASVGRPVALINDARAFGLAESRMGAGRGNHVVIALVLGTGVGGAIVIGGNVFQGSDGLAGEIGHMTLEMNGPICGCGNRGCLEALVRSDVLSANAGTSSVAEAVTRAIDGDKRAAGAVEQAGRWIGLCLANVTTLFRPDAVVIGGGVAQAGDILLSVIEQELRERSPLVPRATYRFVTAQLGPAAGAVGAAIMAHDLQKSSEIPQSR